MAQLIVLLVFSNAASAVDIHARVDRNPVNFNSSFSLTFTAKDSPDGDPDFSPLEKDFEVINQQKNIQSSFVNGKFQVQSKWVVKLFAKRTGKIVIPAIAFGKDLSFPTSVNVVAKTNVDNITKDIFLEVTATPESPYVQAQVIYTVRLYHRVQLARGSHLSEPQAQDAVIEKLGEDKNYETTLKGIRFSVIERKYAIYPQKSGELTIEPLILTAQVVDGQSSRFNGFFNSQVTSSKRVSSRSWTLQVKPVPEQLQSAHWLPAEHLYIEEKWSNPKMSVTVGEPITRTISLLAKGVAASQLPDIASTQEHLNIKSYPDQPLLKEKDQADGMVALREEKIAYIPSSAGEITLPAIEIPWYNTQTHKIEVARLPPVKLEAIATTSTKPAVKPKQEAITSELSAVDATLPPATRSLTTHPVWMWLCLVLFIGWSITLVYFLRRQSNRPHASKPKDDEHTIDENFSKNELKQACQTNNPQLAQKALLAWGKQQFNVYSLAHIAQHCNAPLAAQIHLLRKALYAENGREWNAIKLYTAFNNYRLEESKDSTKKDVLEPLFRV